MRKVKAKLRLISVGVVACLFIGGFTLSANLLHASSNTASLEPETGTIGTPATIINDESASGGSATLFGSSIVKPGPSNTGVPAGHTPVEPTSDSNRGIYVDSSGNVTISKAGVFDDMLVKGRLNIRASNVTIRYSRIEGAPTPWDKPADPTSEAECQARGSVDSATLIKAYNKDASGNYYTNLVIEDSTIVADHPSIYNGNAIHGSNYTLRRDDISGTVDGAGLFSDEASANILIENSYIHDLYVGKYDYNHNCGPTHSDGLQLHFGNGMIIRYNTIKANAIDINGNSAQSNAAIMVNQNGGKNTSHVDILHNWLDYGACTVNISDNGLTPTIKYLNVSDNLFGNHHTVNDCAITSHATVVNDSTNTFSGNQWEDGSQPPPVVRD